MRHWQKKANLEMSLVCTVIDNTVMLRKLWLQENICLIKKSKPEIFKADAGSLSLAGKAN